jgi:hypothetical protein
MEIEDKRKEKVENSYKKRFVTEWRAQLSRILSPLKTETDAVSETSYMLNIPQTMGNVKNDILIIEIDCHQS